MLGALRDPGIWHELEKREAAFRKAVAGDEDVLAAFATIEESRRRRGELFDERVFMRMDGRLGGVARNVVNSVTRSEADGGPGEAQLEQLAGRLVPDDLNEDLEVARLAAGLETARAILGREHPFVKAALGDRHPLDAAKHVVASTGLRDEDHVRALLAGGREALEKADDPLIRMALVREPRVRALTEEVQTLAAREDAAVTTLARARFRVHGTDIYPDATFTLRLSFGVVKGYELGTTDVPWKTNFWGLYARNSSMGNEFPYDLPEEWLRARDHLDLDTPLNFVSTADTTGGNSGSPAVDRKGDVVGLLFDGNIQSLRIDNLYDEKVARSVLVDVRGIAHALERVYRAYHLLAELGVHRAR